MIKTFMNLRGIRSLTPHVTNRPGHDVNTSIYATMFPGIPAPAPPSFFLFSLVQKASINIPHEYSLDTFSADGVVRWVTGGVRTRLWALLLLAPGSFPFALRDGSLCASCGTYRHCASWER